VTPLIALRIYAPCTPARVADLCRLDLGSARDALHRMRSKGLATRTGGLAGGMHSDRVEWSLSAAGVAEFQWLHCAASAAT
jgi:hypothetical protein